jgi:hypothetical protein
VNEIVWYKDARFIIASVIGFVAAIPGVVALFQTHEVRVQLESWNDSRLKMQVSRDIADFGQYLLLIGKTTSDSIRYTSSRMSFNKMGRSTKFMNAIKRIAKSARDSIDHRWLVLNRNLQDYIMRSGFRDSPISEVSLLRSESDSLATMEMAKESLKTRITQGVHEIFRSRGLP